MNKIINNKFLTNLSIFFAILVSFFFLYPKFQYAIVMTDDIYDLIVNPFNLYHGRIFSELFNYFIVIKLPEILEIHIQDFAIYSEGLFKILIIITTSFVLSKNITKSEINIFNSISFLFCFFFICTVSFNFEIINLMDTNQYFIGYFIPTCFFLLFLQKITKLIINEKINKKSDFYKLIFYTIFLIQSNEFLSITTILLLTSLFFKYKQINELKILIITSILSGIIIFTSIGFLDIFSYYRNDFGNLQKINLIDYLISFILRILIYNSFLLLPTGIYLYILKKNKEQNNDYLKIRAIILHCLTAMILFLFLIQFLLNDSPYGNKYWFYYPPVQYSFQIIICSFLLFLTKRLYSKFGIKVILTTVFFLVCFLCKSYISSDIKDTTVYTYENKKSLYLIEKMALFYTKKEENAILCNTIKNIFYSDKESQYLPYDLVTNTYKGKTYYYNYRNEPFIFIPYLEETYKIKIKKDTKFEEEDEAIRIFKENGGVITDTELKELKFKNIK